MNQKLAAFRVLRSIMKWKYEPSLVSCGILLLFTDQKLKSTEPLSFADNTKTHYILRQIYE